MKLCGFFLKKNIFFSSLREDGESSRADLTDHRNRYRSVEPLRSSSSSSSSSSDEDDEDGLDLDRSIPESLVREEVERVATAVNR